MKILKKHHCRIDNYPIEVKVSDKRREKYWKHGEAVPKKYISITTIDNKGFLLDTNGERLVKNIKTAGTPRMLAINFQKLYVGVHHSVRAKIIEELHTVINAAFAVQLPTTIDTKDKKILIHLHFYNTITRHTPDLDNMSSLFVKCGIDCLTTANNPNQTKGSGYSHKLGIIPDDTTRFIPYVIVEFTEIKEDETRKLDFNLYEVETGFSIEDLLDKQLLLDNMITYLENQPDKYYGKEDEC